MSERDAEGYWTGHGGHLWKTDRGPDSACAWPGCGLYYSQWAGGRCPEAPNCTAVRGDIPCAGELDHEGDHYASVEW